MLLLEKEPEKERMERQEIASEWAIGVSGTAWCTSAAACMAAHEGVCECGVCLRLIITTENVMDEKEKYLQEVE